MILVLGLDNKAVKSIMLNWKAKVIFNKSEYISHLELAGDISIMLRYMVHLEQIITPLLKLMTLKALIFGKMEKACF